MTGVGRNRGSLVAGRYVVDGRLLRAGACVDGIDLGAGARRVRLRVLRAAELEHADAAIAACAAAAAAGAGCAAPRDRVTSERHELCMLEPLAAGPLAVPTEAAGGRALRDAARTVGLALAAHGVAVGSVPPRGVGMGAAGPVVLEPPFARCADPAAEADAFASALAGAEVPDPARRRAPRRLAARRRLKVLAALAATAIVVAVATGGRGTPSHPAVTAPPTAPEPVRAAPSALVQAEPVPVPRPPQPRRRRRPARPRPRSLQRRPVVPPRARARARSTPHSTSAGRVEIPGAVGDGEAVGAVPAAP